MVTTWSVVPGGRLQAFFVGEEMNRDETFSCPNQGLIPCARGSADYSRRSATFKNGSGHYSCDYPYLTVSLIIGVELTLFARQATTIAHSSHAYKLWNSCVSREPSYGAPYISQGQYYCTHRSPWLHNFIFSSRTIHGATRSLAEAISKILC